MIRTATHQDKPRAVEMLQAFAASLRPQLGDAVDLFGVEQAEHKFLSHLRGDFTFALAYEVDGVAQGLLLARAFQHDFVPVWLAKEMAWWIEPAHRGRVAARMLDIYERWAHLRNCRFAGMVGMGEDPEIAKLYRRRGYGGAETHYLKAL